MGKWLTRVFFWGFIIGIMAVLAGQGAPFFHFVSQIFNAVGSIFVAAWHGILNVLHGHGVNFH